MKTDTQGEQHATTRAAVAVLQLQAEDCLGHQKLPEARKDPSLEASEGAWPCQHLGVRRSMSRTVRGEISAGLSLPLCSASFWQLWGTHESLLDLCRFAGRAQESAETPKFPSQTQQPRCSRNPASLTWMGILIS